MKNRKFLIGIACGTLMSLLIVGGMYAMTRGGSIQAAEDSSAFEEMKNTSDYDKKKLSILDTVIDKHYINQDQEFELVEGIYKGYVYGLEDPYTMYLNQEEFKKATAEDKGNYVGVGIRFTWGITNQHLVVTEVIEGSPADKEGIKVGDKIIAIDGIKAMGSNEVEIYDKLIYAGEETVEYVIADNNGENEHTVKLIPEEVKINHVTSEILNDEIGYIHLDGLVKGTTQEVEVALQGLVNQGATKLILDLRNAYGNEIEEAVKLADLFLEAKIICGVQNKGEKVINYETTEGSRKEQLAVLIDDGTAGALEATVLALQNAERAILVGQETAGHGTLQEYVGLKDGSGLVIGTGVIMDENGVSIREHAVQPDYVQRMSMDNTLELVTTGKLAKENDRILQKAIESLQ